MTTSKGSRCDHDFSGPPRYKGSDFTACVRGCGAYLDMDSDYVHEARLMRCGNCTATQTPDYFSGASACCTSPKLEALA